MQHLLCASCDPRSWGCKSNGYFSVFRLVALSAELDRVGHFFFLKIHPSSRPYPCFGLPEATPLSQTIAPQRSPLLLYLNMLQAPQIGPESPFWLTLDNHIQSRIFKYHLQANDTQVYVPSHKGKTDSITIFYLPSPRRYLKRTLNITHSKKNS